MIRCILIVLLWTLIFFVPEVLAHALHILTWESAADNCVMIAEYQHLCEGR